MGRNKSKSSRYSDLLKHAERWAQQFNDGLLSVPDDVGDAHIVYSIFNGDDKAILRRHVDSLANKWRLQRGGSAVIQITCNPSIDDLKTIVQDHTVSTLAFVGHGSLGAWWRYDAKVHSAISWYDFATMSTHLKQGTVEQRTCASSADSKTVRLPVGTFMVSDQRNVIAPVGYALGGCAGSDEFEDVLRPVFVNEVNTPSDLISQVHDRVRLVQHLGAE